MAVINNGIVLAEGVTIDPNAGLLCYKNNIATGNTLTSSAADGFPASNLANVATAFPWRASSTSDQTITINNAGRPVNYVGYARHNLDQIGVTIEYKFDGLTVLAEESVSEVQAQLVLFNEASPDTIQIIIKGGSVPVFLGTLYAGLSTKMERNIYVGHTPITYGRDRRTINGVSENGQFLGEIVLRENLSTSVKLQNLTPEWYRSELDPFLKLRPRRPAFWAWRPTDYPSEIAFAWVEGNPRPSNQRSNGMMQITFNLRAIV